MRKHDPRKWLHAVLDLLPVIFIPVFMVYSHRHTISDYQVQYSENKVVNFNQQVTNPNLVNSIDNWISYDSHYTTITHVNGGLTTIIDDSSNNLYEYGVMTYFNNSIVGHKYLITCDYTVNGSFNLMTDAYGGNQIFSNGYILWNCNTSVGRLLIKPTTVVTVNNSFTLYYVNIYDLTLMFGEGEEPSYDQFISWYPNDYYNYNLGHKELLKDYQTVTYNNTDIGSQLLYSIYNPVHDYMNFNNVFNFGQIYDWLQLNIFGGTAPMSVFIVWNIVLYEFLMDLIFLLYALFMFFIDFCTNLIDRFHIKCSGGK